MKIPFLSSQYQGEVIKRRLIGGGYYGCSDHGVSYSFLYLRWWDITTAPHVAWMANFVQLYSTSKVNYLKKHGTLKVLI